MGNRKTDTRCSQRTKHTSQCIFSLNMLNMSLRAPSLLQKRFPLRTKKAILFGFGEPKNTRLSNNRSWWDWIHVGTHFGTIIQGLHCMAGIHVSLPFDRANCILRRWYHRCPRPHQWWAWWPGCRCFPAPYGWTVERKKFKTNTRQRALIIHETSEAEGPGFRKPLQRRAHRLHDQTRTYTISLSPHMNHQIYSDNLECNTDHRRDFWKTHTGWEVRF